MNVATLELPTTIGTPFGGGTYAGRFFIGEQPYALIVAPADVGELEETKWGNLKKISGASSYCDGFANTQAMRQSGSVLGLWATDLRIGEYDDWYIPSRLEALILFGEFGDTDTFQSYWYWTSTQCASNGACAWCQTFDGGYQYYDRKDTKLRARAVRRLAL